MVDKGGGMVGVKRDLRDVCNIINGVAAAAMRELHAEIIERLSFNITPQQVAIAVYLSRHGGKMTVTGLAREMGVTLSAITSGATRMSSCQLINRIRDEADHRMVWLSLTGLGWRVAAVYDEVQESVYRRLFGPLTDRDLDTLYEILKKIQAGINSAPEE